MFMFWNFNPFKLIPKKKSHGKGTNRHADKQTDGHRDSMKESAKGRFFENITLPGDHSAAKKKHNGPPLLLESFWSHVMVPRLFNFKQICFTNILYFFL